MNKLFNAQGSIKYTKAEKHFLMPYKSLFFVAEFLATFSLLNCVDIPTTIAFLLGLFVAGVTCMSPSIGLFAFACCIAWQYLSAGVLISIIALVCLLPFIVSSQLMITLIMMATEGLIRGELFGGQLFLIFILACFIADKYEKPEGTKLSISVPLFAIYFGACYSVKSTIVLASHMAQNTLILEAVVFAAVLGAAIMFTFGLVKINFKLPKKWQKNLSNDCILFLIIIIEIIALSFAAKQIYKLDFAISFTEIIGGGLAALALSRLFSHEGLIALLKKKANRTIEPEVEDNRTRDEKILTSLNLSKNEYRKSLWTYIASGAIIAIVTFSIFMTISTVIPLWAVILISAFSFGLPFTWEFADIVLPKKLDTDSEKIFFSFTNLLSFLAKIKDIILAWYIAIVVVITYRKAIKKAPKESQEKREQKGVKDFFENLINQIIDVLSNASGTGIQGSAAVNTAYASSAVAASAMSEVGAVSSAGAYGMAGFLSPVTTQIAAAILSAVIVAGGVGIVAPALNQSDEPIPAVIEEPIDNETTATEIDVNTVKFKDYVDSNGILIFPVEKNRPPHATYEVLDEFVVASSNDQKEKTLIAPEDGIYGTILDIEGISNMDFMDALYEGKMPYFCQMGTYEYKKETGYSSSGYGTSIDAKHTVRNIMTITCNKGDTIFYNVGPLESGNKMTVYFVRYKTSDDDPIDMAQRDAISAWGQTH